MPMVRWQKKLFPRCECPGVITVQTFLCLPEHGDGYGLFTEIHCDPGG